MQGNRGEGLSNEVCNKTKPKELMKATIDIKSDTELAALIGVSVDHLKGFFWTMRYASVSVKRDV